MTEVVDLLAALREGSRRGAGREVDLYHPAPSTRGTQDGSGSGGQTQAAPMDGGRAAMLSRDHATRERLYDGSFSDADVAWARERLRTPNLLTRNDGLLRVSCLDCPLAHKPMMYGLATVAASVCELDGVCWQAERDAEAELHKPLPLWRLRKRNGKPNYATATEQETYLRESGWLAWSAGARKGPDAGVAATSGNRTQKIEWPQPWESWVEALHDPRRMPPADAPLGQLADWQKDLIGADEPLPIEKLATPSPWRQWNGDRAEVETCGVCGEKGGYSVAGSRYCQEHAAIAESALHRGEAFDEEDVSIIETESEVAA
jgi:hypothetical protein